MGVQAAGQHTLSNQLQRCMLHSPGAAQFVARVRYPHQTRDGIGDEHVWNDTV